MRGRTWAALLVGHEHLEGSAERLAQGHLVRGAGGEVHPLPDAKAAWCMCLEETFAGRNICQEHLPFRVRLLVVDGRSPDGGPVPAENTDPNRRRRQLGVQALCLSEALLVGQVVVGLQLPMRRPG